MAAALEATPFDEAVKHAVVVNRQFGVVMGAHTFCDPTASCWDANRPSAYFPWRY